MGTMAKTNSNRLPTPRKPSTASQPAKKPARPNSSILNFFQKTEKPEDSLFVGAALANAAATDDDIYGHDGQDRYGEIESPNKRRRLSHDQHASINGAPADQAVASPAEQIPKAKPKPKMPFIIESDDESDQESDQNTSSKLPIRPPEDAKAPAPTSPSPAGQAPPPPPPPLHHEQTSATDDDFDGFEGDDLDLDTFEGEEMRERRFMQEQARLEAEEAGDMSLFDESFAEAAADDGTMEQCCPICSGSFQGISAEEATRHVNSCLDGNPIPLPKSPEQTKAPAEAPQVGSVEIGKRFMRAAVPRPGQANPFDVDGRDKGSKSAFSQLMSGNAEDSAWATAAAAETSSRGRPAYMRTCPFYKIMPGFSICVDAFRYGAVEGCQAYFLSHFHSDHYVGLTANWTHGPIYCSEVTASLVKSQLRTAAKFVVALRFDEEYEVPGTDGAKVTMIPANHCPGSSMFVFEKTVGSGSGRRMKRILHCGDFRACSQHVKHPLLKPDISDSVTGKLRQQKIDLCYLDTTYLNPRYSFPPQNDVIQACADVCASMSPDPNSKDDVWEAAKREAGNTAVSKYFQSDKQPDTQDKPPPKKKLGQRLLVICGTYSIGKERICVAIAKALKSKIFASPAKIKICRQLGDPELSALLTSNPVDAQVHMQMLMEIRAETLQEYLDSYRPHFSRIVGFRPSGWNFRPTNSKSVGANASPSTIPSQQILHGKGWRTRFGAADLVAQRGSTKEAMCFGVPYSEHSSFRELALFVMSLRIDKVIPTVNVGSEQSRKRMKGWIDKWTADRRKGGLVHPLVEDEDEDDSSKVSLWEGKSGKGGDAWW